RTPRMPSLVSIVAKGQLEAIAPAFVIALKSVDLPTFGNPTIPAVKDIIVAPLVYNYFFKSFIKISARHHNRPFAIRTSDFYVRTHPHNLETVCAAGMRFFHLYNII